MLRSGEAAEPNNAKKEPSKGVMSHQSQRWSLGGTRPEAGNGEGRSRMVKGSEIKLIRGRKQTC